MTTRPKRFENMRDEAVSCGIDFGTTNSSVALASRDGVEVLVVDEENDTPTLLPSLLYMSRHGERFVGRAAANTFIERNVGRRVVLKQVDLNLVIPGYVGAEPDKGESYRPHIQEEPLVMEGVRVSAQVEVNSPGRLFQSLKSVLGDRTLTQTRVFGQPYQIEELVSIILQHLREKVEAQSVPVQRVVFGRPVRFSEDEEGDLLAERRLRTAAKLAGFGDVMFLHEPVAACVDYAAETAEAVRVMVVDIGGGTCDVSITAFEPHADVPRRIEHSRILGVHGIPIAGDALDCEIIRGKLFPLFGSRARYGPNGNLRMPQSLFAVLTNWRNLHKQNTEEFINWLIAAEMSSDQPERLRALRYVIQRNLGYPLNRAVERAKKELSAYDETYIEFVDSVVAVHERITRGEFEDAVEHLIDRMRDCVMETEKRAQVSPDEIDLVLTTGGTTLVPAVRRMLCERYGEARLRQRDTFTAVAKGLALYAYHQERM